MKNYNVLCQHVLTKHCLTWFIKAEHQEIMKLEVKLSVNFQPALYCYNVSST